jgi:phosphotransferase system HPr-like phosphotransfer protein
MEAKLSWKLEKENMYHLQDDGQKANARSSYKILLLGLEAGILGKFKLSAFAQNNCAHYEFRIEFLNVKLWT